MSRLLVLILEAPSCKTQAIPRVSRQRPIAVFKILCYTSRGNSVVPHFTISSLRYFILTVQPCEVAVTLSLLEEATNSEKFKSVAQDSQLPDAAGRFGDIIVAKFGHAAVLEPGWYVSFSLSSTACWEER